MRAKIEAVALDAMGVIYPVADDLRDLLLPFLRSKGCAAPDEAIVTAFRACYRDGAPAGTIWSAAGFDGDGEALEREFLPHYLLNPGVREFLEAMQRQSIPVFGLSNDVGEWARQRLKTLGLEALFAGWVFSSEVRSYKPQPEIYQRLIEMLPCRPEACLFVDDRAENLDAAATHGLQTVLFGKQAASFDGVQDFAEPSERIRQSPNSVPRAPGSSL